MRKIFKRVLLTIVFGIISLFLAGCISFLISNILPGDRVLPYLPEGHIDPALYDEMYRRLGLDRPWFEQLFRYLGAMFAGDWGQSLSISRGMSVFELISVRVLPTLLLLLVPLIIGMILGFFFGNFSQKYNSKKELKMIEILSLLGFIIPIITLILSFQFALTTLNPISDLILIWMALTISIMGLSILLSRLYLVKRKMLSKKHSNLIFIIIVGICYGIVYALLIQTEIMFSFEGLGKILLQALNSTDYYVINTVIFLMLFTLPIFIIFSLFSFFVFGKIKSHYKLKQ